MGIAVLQASRVSRRNVRDAGNTPLKQPKTSQIEEDLQFKERSDPRTRGGRRVSLEMEDREAIDFAERHLRKLRVDASGWMVEYEDPNTGEIWVMDYPHGEYHGGGSPRQCKCPPNDL